MTKNRKRELTRTVTSKIVGDKLSFDWSNVWEQFFLSGEYGNRLAAYTAAASHLNGANYRASALATESRKNATLAYYRCHTGNSVPVTITDPDTGLETVLTGRKAESHRCGSDPVTSFFRMLHDDLEIALNVVLPFGSARSGNVDATSIDL